MGELTTSLAREHNQPLTSVLSNARAAEEPLRADQPNLAEVREIVQGISRADKRASEVIHRLRTLVRKGSVDPSRSTSHDDAGTRERIRQSGAAGYLAKPFERQALLETLRRVVGGA
jgi:DNA-binding NarL/FixJ family response regulator